jgi:CDP-diacylglycerol--serine O-phosphatidyltransferase
MTQETTSPTENNQTLTGPKLVKSKLQGSVFVIPSLITIIGLFCGFLALISAMKGNFTYAIKCIALSFILDGLDGRVARKLNATSDFGKEIDSLSDIVAFGVAPAVLLYNWGLSRVADEFGILIAFLFVACGALRLARFNIIQSDSGKKHFDGLPIPAAAATVAVFVLAHPEKLVEPLAVGFAICLGIFLSGLMVSKIPFISVKNLRITPKNLPFYLTIFSLVVGLAWYGSNSFLVITTAGYVLSGPIMYLVNRKKKSPEEEIKKSAGKA